MNRNLASRWINDTGMKMRLVQIMQANNIDYKMIQLMNLINYNIRFFLKNKVYVKHFIQILAVFWSAFPTYS